MLDWTVGELRLCANEPVVTSSHNTPATRELDLSCIRSLVGTHRRSKQISRESQRLESPFPPIYPIRPIAAPQVDEERHPEALALAKYCVGRGVDIGCGHRKVTPECIGVDIIPAGERGQHGVVAGKVSVADIHASGDDLSAFKDGELDFVVSKHNLEHYVDLIKTLREWKRVLRMGGVLAAVVPDERSGDTIFLDPTHKHCFTPESLTSLIELLGLKVEKSEVVVPNWSFMIVARRID
jgi:SAM-dependent methyltransferase